MKTYLCKFDLTCKLLDGRMCLLYVLAHILGLCIKT